MNEADVVVDLFDVYGYRIHDDVVTMLSRKDLSAAVFIGGMGGILVEHEMFSQYHPNAKVLAVGSPGGAAKELATKIGTPEDKREQLDFVELFRSELGIEPDEKRRSDLYG
jgi:hypothetical protein